MQRKFIQSKDKFVYNYHKLDIQPKIINKKQDTTKYHKFDTHHHHISQIRCAHIIIITNLMDTPQTTSIAYSYTNRSL